MVYKLLACGGTFDHFHKGHREFIIFATSVAEHVTIGITSDEYIKKHKKNELIEPFLKRESEVKDFIASKKLLHKVTLVSLDDAFGPTLNETIPFDSLLVSKNTLQGAEELNKARLRIGLQKLIVLTVNDVLTNGVMVSSSAIRNGKMDREGNLYIEPSMKQRSFKITLLLRQLLKMPLGELITDFDSYIEKQDKSFFKHAITVGDAVTKTFNDNKINHKLSVIDFSVNRVMQYISTKQLGFKGTEKRFSAKNPPGFITGELLSAIELSLEQKENNIVLQVIGEEDLAVLPIILLAPLGDTVYYGQPNKGVVKVEITESKKNEVKDFFMRFERQ